MTRLAQFGVFTSVTGAVATFMALFPSAMLSSLTPGIGLGQILLALFGLSLLVAGAYVFVYATWLRGRPQTLSQSIGIRMGLTGLTFAVAASLADVFGFGSHSLAGGFTFGEVQAAGMAIGFLIAALGVVIYGIRRY